MSGAGGRPPAGPVIATDAHTRTVYATDNSIYQVEPAGVATPASADEVRVLVAASAGANRPVTARGGGTGTNGQSLTDGLVLDLKRRMNRLVSVDPGARTAVVEPGLVTARLNALLRPHGLHWAPHTSTLSRCTVGGMISTDAAGKGSLIHGRTHRHVLALDVVLDDGTPWRAEPVPVAEAERRAAAGGRGGELWRTLLDLPLAEGARYDLPELARGFSGYGIDRVRRDGLIDPVPLLCGAEGTLAVITSATIRLTPLPARTLLVIAGYDSFAEALDDAVELAATAPSAIECSDETTLEQGRSSPAWPVLSGLIGDHHGSVLLLEYTSDDPAVEPDPGPVRAALAATGRSRTVVATTDRAEQAAAWKVREDAVGLLAKVVVGQPERSARPTAMVEDCAVPVAEMAAFIAGFRAVLDGHGLAYGMFGHADVGCVHVRPALDLTDPAHERLVRTVTDEVVALVARHGGVLWGEHGRGFRGDAVERFLPPETISVMRAVKTAFDPHDRLNPGKLYRPLGAGPGAAATAGAGPAGGIVAVDGAPMRGQVNRVVPVAVRREFGHAFACNGNGLCFHYDGAEVMCPSYKATGDPALSPKGRADLLRAWLVRRERGAPDLEAFEDDLATNLHQCLSCSACTGHCPVEVDIPELKSRFLEQHHQRRRRPLSHQVLGRFESLAPLLAKAPALGRLGTGPAGRLLGLVDLPTPGRRPPGVLPAFDPADPTGVVLMPDVFTATLEPATLHRAVAVLRAVGATVSVAPFVPSGKFDHVKGRRAAFARAVAAQARLVDRIAATGATPVVIEPAVGLLHRHEYPALDPAYPSGPVRLLSEVLDERRDRLAALAPPAGGGEVALLGHCTERATAPASLAAWARVLAAAGYTVSTPDLGCCGMAGIFGHEAANQEMSRALWDLTWAAHVPWPGPNPGAGPVPVATGYSCRSQAKRFTGAAPVHPVHLLPVTGL